jgi:A/G-specific adenine glycosylase
MIWDFYRDYGRSMPWRDTISPYYVFVSEVMLQQTQVSRVTPKFLSFVERFPGFPELAGASLADVLDEWSGLGYNRRARYLRDAAIRIRESWGELPRDPDTLATLPGIGRNTAGSIAAFAYNQPVVFIETNIRRVYIHCFFPDRSEVEDREIVPLIRRDLDLDNPREWYWALMDYGAELKKSGNANTRSRAYKRQSRFDGSDRQIRGCILRAIRSQGQILSSEVASLADDDEERATRVIDSLVRDGLLVAERIGEFTSYRTAK